MSMVIPNSGKILFLYWAVGTNGSDLEDFTIDLYQNNYTPVDASTSANFTVATFPGYQQVVLPRSGFSAPGIVANIAQIIAETVPTYTCNGGAGQLVYGWFLRGETSGTCLAAQLFSTPRNMTSGAQEQINPFTISLKTFA